MLMGCQLLGFLVCLWFLHLQRSYLAVEMEAEMGVAGLGCSAEKWGSLTHFYSHPFSAFAAGSYW